MAITLGSGSSDSCIRDCSWNMCTKGICSQVSVNTLDQYLWSTFDWHSSNTPTLLTLDQHLVRQLVEGRLNLDLCIESFTIQLTVDWLLIKCWLRFYLVLIEMLIDNRSRFWVEVLIDDITQPQTPLVHMVPKLLGRKVKYPWERYPVKLCQQPSYSHSHSLDLGGKGQVVTVTVWVIAKRTIK